MNEWIIFNNGREIIYSDYQEALKYFLTIVADHLWNNSYNNKDNGSPVYDHCCTPDRVGEFLEIRYEERTISDEEIVIQSRLNMLLDPLLSKDDNEIKNNALKVIKHSINYHSRNEEFDEDLDINVELKTEEIVVDIVGEDSLFKTNAFIFDNDLQKYYFISKQRITTSNDPEHLGKMVEISIALQPYDEDVKEELYQKQKTEFDTYIIKQYRKLANINKDVKITEIDEWALNKVSAENNFDVHELRELLLANKR